MMKTNSTAKNKEMPKNPLDHPKKALVFAQIYIAPEPVTVKEIAGNTGLPLNTVYNYIGELSKEDIIRSKTESVGNLIQDRWFINPDYDKARRSQIRTIVNSEFDDFFLTDPTDLGRQLTMLNSFAVPYIREYQRQKDKFASSQEKSPSPAIIKIWSLASKEFEYAVGEIEKVRKHLRELDKALRNQQEIPSIHLPLKNETNLVFMVALPNINQKKQER